VINGVLWEKTPLFSFVFTYLGKKIEKKSKSYRGAMSKIGAQCQNIGAWCQI